ncbi:hypothetical protein BYT27DRAFT_7207619 [Phlegmacium glaucopus]|nr:hypothetical protein BYT27DRAFT_7207619 [Phlegmacium glaucopus]
MRRSTSLRPEDLVFVYGTTMMGDWVVTTASTGSEKFKIGFKLHNPGIGGAHVLLEHALQSTHISPPRMGPDRPSGFDYSTEPDSSTLGQGEKLVDEKNTEIPMSPGSEILTHRTNLLVEYIFKESAEDINEALENSFKTERVHIQELLGISEEIGKKVVAISTGPLPPPELRVGDAVVVDDVLNEIIQDYLLKRRKSGPQDRPTLLFSTGSQAKIEVPPGWFTTISAISRKDYNQLITCNFKVRGDEKSHYIINKWGQLNLEMQDMDSSEDVVTIITQEEAIILELNAYFSTVASVKGDALKADKYRCSRLHILGSRKRPQNLPKDFPDSSTFTIFVEDSHLPLQFLAHLNTTTLTIVKGEVHPPQPLDAASQALAQTGKDAIEGFINAYTDPTQPGPTIDPAVVTPPPPHPYNIPSEGAVVIIIV